MKNNEVILPTYLIQEDSITIEKLESKIEEYNGFIGKPYTIHTVIEKKLLEEEIYRLAEQLREVKGIRLLPSVAHYLKV